MAIITACMPSFAKVLHHHFPLWATIKTRLKSFALTYTRKGMSRNQTAISKDSGPTYLNKGCLHLEERPHMHDLDLGEIELESLKSVKYKSRGAALETFDDDKILLEA